MKTLNKKNTETINKLLFNINRDRYLSKNLHDKRGSDFWYSLKCENEAKLNIIKLFEEFGICYDLEETIERWITRKDEFQEEMEKAWKYYLQTEKEKYEKSA